MKLKDLETMQHILDQLLNKTTLPSYPSVGTMEALEEQLKKDREKTITLGEVSPLVSKVAQQFYEIRKKVRIEEAYAILREEGIDAESDYD